LDNLLDSWREFLRGKRKRRDVAEFSLNLMDNILTLRQDLVNKTYCHGSYRAFKINDPKPRNIHKASVRDRLVHHAIYRILYPYFDQKFIFDSYSCRKNKGTHRAINRFRNFGRIVSRNNTRTIWVLQCDIRKFFASIDHHILKNILAKYVKDRNVLWLFSQVINSFSIEGKIGVGLPLGNLTSQLLVNIYLNEFDQFVKRQLKILYYIRYADDFIILAQDKACLEQIVPKISEFLMEKLHLQIHPQKLSIKTLSSGIDFLGYISFPNYLILRTKTKSRMLKRVNKNNLPSYSGLLKHCNGYRLTKQLTARFT